MKIILKQNLENDVNNLNSAKPNSEETLNLFRESLKQLNADSSTRISQVDDETIEVYGMPSMALHNFALKCEQMGRKVDYTKEITLNIR